MSDVYSNPQLARFLDSMEGVPDWPQPGETPAEQAMRGSLQNQAHQVFGWLGALAPGLALASGLSFAGLRGSSWLGTSVLGFAHSPISAIMVALLLGLLIRNVIGLPSVYESGLKFCLRHILRLGIMLLGLRLSLTAVAQIGLVGLPIIVVCIATALCLVTWITRALGLPRRLGSLIAVGTSICGVSAIVATAPVIDAEDDEVSYAVACVTLFGMLALFLYPWIAHFVFQGDPRRVGLFLGTSIHDTAQVAGASLIYQQQFHAPEALNTATVVKLVRNLFMAGVIPLMALLYHRGTDPSARAARPKWHQVVPLFV
ncbi:MAG TPA: putative sulfate exporter family transporter, partial [Isosphaeraceae bacterium]|nr:putative sulfate exporter family transporter [Isosphaeraceae bacterium]